MNEILIENFNKKVSSRDVVYLLGDIVWGHQNYINFFSKLNGQKHLILGNHDHERSYRKLLPLNLLQSISKTKTITINKKDIFFLSHFPHRSWNMSHYGSFHVYGHTHNTLPDYGKSTDVGVDKWDFNPVSYEELIEYFKINITIKLDI